MSSKKIATPMAKSDLMGTVPARNSDEISAVKDHNTAPDFDKPHDVGGSGISEVFFVEGPYKNPPGKMQLDSPMKNPIALKKSK